MGCHVADHGGRVGIKVDLPPQSSQGTQDSAAATQALPLCSVASSSPASVPLSSSSPLQSPEGLGLMLSAFQMSPPTFLRTGLWDKHQDCLHFKGGENVTQRGTETGLKSHSKKTAELRLETRLL